MHRQKEYTVRIYISSTIPLPGVCSFVDFCLTLCILKEKKIHRGIIIKCVILKNTAQYQQEMYCQSSVPWKTAFTCKFEIKESTTNKTWHTLNNKIFEKDQRGIHVPMKLNLSLNYLNYSWIQFYFIFI